MSCCCYEKRGRCNNSKNNCRVFEGRGRVRVVLGGCCTSHGVSRWWFSRVSGSARMASWKIVVCVGDGSTFNFDFGKSQSRMEPFTMTVKTISIRNVALKTRTPWTNCKIMSDGCRGKTSITIHQLSSRWCSCSVTTFTLLHAGFGFIIIYHGGKARILSYDTNSSQKKKMTKRDKWVS